MTQDPTLIRAAVLAELGRRSWTINRLTVEMQGQIGRQTIYDWLTGQSRINDEAASLILGSLGLVVKARRANRTKSDCKNVRSAQKPHFCAKNAD